MDELGVYEEFVESTRHKLIGWLVRQTQDRMLAEDIAQDTYWRLWCNRDRVTGWGRPILFRQAWFLLVDNVRYAHRIPVPVAKVPEKWEPTYDPYEELFDDQAGEPVERTIQKILAELTPKQRAVLLLTANGYSYDEIAATLCLPLGTVKSRINNARTMARKRRVVS